MEKPPNWKRPREESMSICIDCAGLRQARAAHLWTQEDFAAASGLSTRTIQRIEARGRCSKDSLKALAAALDIDPLELISDTEEAAPPVIDRSWVVGPIMGMMGGLIGCSVGAYGVCHKIITEGLEMALPGLVFVTVMTLFAICFPTYVIYSNWNRPVCEWAGPDYKSA